MTKAQFLARMEEDFMPPYTKKYPQFERSMREYLDKIKNDQMGAHAWGNFACIVVNFAYTTGLNVQALDAYMKGQRADCIKANNFS